MCRDTPRSWAAGRITSAARSTVPLMSSRMGSNLSLFDSRREARERSRSIPSAWVTFFWTTARYRAAVAGSFAREALAISL